jgi:hypothetical protein
MNAAHAHLLVNHLPIVGFALAFVLLCATVIRRGDRGMFLATIILLAIAGVGALAAQLTGEPAEEVVEHLPDIPHDLIEEHEEAGFVATMIAGVTSLLALILCVLALRRQGPVPMPVLSILLLATALAVGAMCWTGNLGGKIRHSELRGTAPMTTDDHGRRSGSRNLSDYKMDSHTKSLNIASSEVGRTLKFRDLLIICAHQHASADQTPS